MVEAPLVGSPGARNVLITAAGRRTSLVVAFADEAHRRNATVVAADVDPLAPGLFLADECIRLLGTTETGYADSLIELVRTHAIGLLIPTIDPDLPILARHRETLRGLGCVAAVSSESFIGITNDKFKTVSVFGAKGVAVPESWSPEDKRAKLPDLVFVKPRRGSASQGASIQSSRDLPRIVANVEDPILQEVLTGQEITIDALLDLDGRPVHYVPRSRIRTLAGESIQGVTLAHDPDLEAWIENILGICGSLGAAGPLCLQAFLTERGPVLSEINGRFGGGFPLCLAAGGRYPAWLLDMVEGIPVPSHLGEYQSGLYMTRYHVEVFTRSPKW